MLLTLVLFLQSMSFGERIHPGGEIEDGNDNTEEGTNDAIRSIVPGIPNTGENHASNLGIPNRG